MTTRKLRAFGLGVAVTLLGLLPSHASTADIPTVRVATLGLESTADVYYAQDEGFFKDAGINVVIDQMAGGAAILSAVEGGSYDIGATNFATLGIAREHGVALDVIVPGAIHDTSTPTELLMVRKDSAINTATDLNGKTVGVNVLGAISQLAGEAWIAQHGGDWRSVHFVEIPYPAMADALQQGRIDAMAIAEPFATPAKAGARPLADTYDAISPHFIFTCMVADDAWLRAHADAATRFAAAMRRAHTWANANQSASAAILLRSTKLTPQILATMTRTVFATSPDPQLIAPFLDAAVKYGMLARPISATDLVWKP